MLFSNDSFALSSPGRHPPGLHHEMAQENLQYFVCILSIRPLQDHLFLNLLLYNNQMQLALDGHNLHM